MTIAVSLGLFILLLTLLCAAFWTVGVVSGLRRDYRGTLRKSFVSSLDVRGFLTTMIVLCVPVPFSVLSTAERAPLDDPLSTSVLIGALVLLAYSGVLWGITLFLHFKPKQPVYVFHLPRDAEEVRRRGCEDGIMLAAVTYPKIITNRDWLDTFMRAMQVGTRESVFPQGKRAELQLTNDFAVYCDIQVEGCEKGYYGFIEQRHIMPPDQFEGILTQLQRGDPASEEVKTLLQTLVQQIMRGDKGG